MPPASKRKKASKTASGALAAVRRDAKQKECRKQALVRKWEDIAENFEAKKDTLTSPKGKARTFEENSMLLLALRGSLNRHLNMVKLGEQETLNWTAIEKDVASTFQVGHRYVNSLRAEFLTSGNVNVWERTVDAPVDAQEEEAEDGILPANRNHDYRQPPRRLAE
jgi:hypothetical protein